MELMRTVAGIQMCIRQCTRNCQQKGSRSLLISALRCGVSRHPLSSSPPWRAPGISVRRRREDNRSTISIPNLFVHDLDLLVEYLARKTIDRGLHSEMLFAFHDEIVGRRGAVVGWKWRV